MMTAFDQLSLTAPFAWLIAAAVLAMAEILIPSFSFLFLSLATLPSAGVAYLGLGLGYQLGAFAASAVALLLLLRPALVARFATGQRGVLSRTDVLIGKAATVTEVIEGDKGLSGRVQVDGEDWAAAAPERLDAGELVKVKGADGIVLNVGRT